MANSDELLELGKCTFLLITVLLIIAWSTVALRIWVRVGITKSPGWDDATIVMTLCLFTCYCAFILVIMTTAAANQHFTMVEVLQTLVYIQLSEIFYILTTTFLKISLGLFFLRLLTKPWQTRLFQGVLAISGVYGIFYFFATVFTCGDPSKLDTNLLNDRTKHCSPVWFILSTGYIYGIINVLADWIFTLIPIFILLDSKMDRREKISVGIVMAFAAVGSISSIMRMVYLKGLLFGRSISPTTVKAVIWATAEPGTGIIAASAAILRPLFRKIFAGVRSKLSESGDSQKERTLGWTREGHDTESVIGLTPVTNAGRDDKNNWRQSMRSIDLNDPWDDKPSMEQARMGTGNAVVITAGKDVRTISVRRQ